jgi:hypothetical protein
VHHRSEDHANAFEINCVCGYSILVPDEAAFNVETPPDDSAIPTAMEAEDEALVVPSPDADAVPDLSDPRLGSIEMTAPEDLPAGMIYDPFELPDVATPEAPQAQNFDESNGDDAGQPIAPVSEPFVDETTPAQTIVERSQLASMGQFLGCNYRLECRNLSQNAMEEILRRCQKLTEQRPWLDTELRKLGMNLEELINSGRMDAVPELLAVEIYLACFELGGNCSFEKLI